MRALHSDSCSGPQPFRSRLPLDYSALGELRLRLREFLARQHVPANVTADVVLCVQEAVTNSMRWAGIGKVEVLVWIEAGEIHAVIRDRGKGFRSAAARRPSVWRSDGRGLFLIKNLMDRMDVDCTDGVTVLLQKRLPNPKTQLTS